MKAVQGEILTTVEPSEGNSHRIVDMAEVNCFSESEMAQLKLIHHGMSNRNFLNHFRELRTKILAKTERKNFCCMVSSLTDGGGASFISANLAAAFSLDQTKSSLLIDCNLENPSVNRLLLNDSGKGLTDYLVDPRIKVSEIVHASGVPRLRVIPLGTHLESAAEHFSSERMKDFISEVKSRYPDRYVIIDAPAITTAESRILAELTDFSALVVPYGKATKQMIHQAVDVVGSEKLIGTMFNN